MLANSGAKPGDALILTKALGTGVISTAIKKEKAEPEWVEAAVKSMTTLNKRAAEIITTYVSGRTAEGGRPHVGNAVHALTDITGFGLIGHAREMALASNVSIELFVKEISFLPGALECVRAGYIPGGLKANREFAECVVHYRNGISEETKTLLFDPQTAGGLLIALAEADAQSILDELRSTGIQAALVGHVLQKTHPPITIC